MKDINTRKRLLDVYFDLCIGKTITINDIMEEYSVSRRTAQRIISDINDSLGGLEISYQNSIKLWRLPHASKRLLVFNNEDYLTLHKIKEAIPSSDKDNIEAMDKIIEKMKNIRGFKAADNDIYTLLQSEGKAVRQYPKENINPETLSIIRNAILSVKKLKIKYKKNNNVETRIVCPYGILSGHKSYLIATDNQSSVYKYFSFAKIINIKEINEYFDMNENFDVEEFKNNSFRIWQGEKFDVVLKFPKDIGENIENYSFHPTQEISVEDDGSVIVKFSASGEVEICREIFKWEPNVQILAPAALIDYYKSTLKNALNKYKKEDKK